MHTTRRGFITGAIALLTTPAIVRASSLESIPRHRYFATIHSHNPVVDIVRDDGRLVGWMLPTEIRIKQPSSVQQLVRMTQEDLHEGTRRHAEEMFYTEGSYQRKSLPIETALKRFTTTPTP